jgi:chemotaxis protein CheX
MSEIQISITDRILTIPLPASLDDNWVAAFNKGIKTWLLSDIGLVHFDFSKMREFKSSHYRHFLVLIQLCKKQNCLVASTSLEGSIQIQIKQDGLDLAFNPQTSPNAVRALLYPEPKKKLGNKLDVAVINPFVEATVKMLAMQAQTKSSPCKPYLVDVNDKSHSHAFGIAGVISLITDDFKGSITLAFPENVFLKIYENMFGEKHTKITPELEDAAGEMVNIIYGTAKTELNAKLGLNLKPALPTILSGDKIRIRQRTNEKLIILPFETDAGLFQIEIAIENNN